MARKKRLPQPATSSTIVPIAGPGGDQGRVTRSRSRANVADVHTGTCSLPDIFKPRKKARGEAAVAASPSPNAEGAEEGLDSEQSFGRGEAAAAASSSPNAQETEDGIDGEQSYGRGEAASPSLNEEGLDSEQSYCPSEEEADGDDDHGAMVVVDDPSNHDAMVIADDRDDPNDTSNTTCGGNNSNHCGGEDNMGTSLTGSATSQESLETIQTNETTERRWKEDVASFSTTDYSFLIQMCFIFIKSLIMVVCYFWCAY